MGRRLLQDGRKMARTDAARIDAFVKTIEPRLYSEIQEQFQKIGLDVPHTNPYPALDKAARVARRELLPAEDLIIAVRDIARNAHPWGSPESGRILRIWDRCVQVMIDAFFDEVPPI
jgi:hypothetical protein